MGIGSSSSLRVRSPSETIAIARGIAPRVGITRVTSTTALDQLGVPVFASIRPGAAPGSLCVSAGKGMTDDEAEAGAYMEAIELAYAEPQRTTLRMYTAQADSIGPDAGAWRRFLPLVEMTGGTELPVVDMTHLRDGTTWRVPAERVLFPLLRADGGGRYGTDGNGLCSGNTRDEATVHGLCELLERDVNSLTFSLKHSTRRIDLATLPRHLVAIAARLDTRGFALRLRAADNAFGLPYFVATVIDRANPDHAYRGDGLHLDAGVAATRAICEACQARLSDIHGGRDDLSLHRAADPGVPRGPEFHRFFAAMMAGPATSFAEIPSTPGLDVDGALALLLERLAAQGIHDVLVAELAPPDLGVSIVRVVAPELEFSGMPGRVGRRLKEARNAWAARR